MAWQGNKVLVDKIDERFYVYLHRDVRGNIFYIGKGSGNRAYSKKGRNVNWRARAGEGFDVKIYRDALSEHCAFCIEKILIATIGLDGLANIAAGGQGYSGWVPSKEFRERLSKRLKGKPMPEAVRTPDAMEKRLAKMRGRIQTEDHKKKISAALKGKSKGGKEFDFYHADHGYVRATCGVMRGVYGLDRNILRLAKGDIPSTKGWTLMENGGRLGRRAADDHHMSDLMVRTFVHEELGSFTGTRHELSAAFSINVSHIGKLVRGENKSCKGWRLKNES